MTNRAPVQLPSPSFGNTKPVIHKKRRVSSSSLDDFLVNLRKATATSQQKRTTGNDNDNGTRRPTLAHARQQVSAGVILVPRNLTPSFQHVRLGLPGLSTNASSDHEVTSVSSTFTKPEDELTSLKG